MTQSFSASVDEAVRKRQMQLLEIFQISAERLFRQIIMDTPVDLGFLRGSYQIVVNRPLPRADRQPGAAAPPDFAGTLVGLRLGDTVGLGYTAVYGPRVHWGFRGTDSAGREYSQQGNPWISRAVVQWQSIVDRAVREVAR